MKATGFFLLLALLCSTAPAQQLQVVYTSPPGTRLSAFDKASAHLSTLRDANGDGVADLMMVREDANGLIDGVIVIDPRTREEILRMDKEDCDEVVGFVNPWGDGRRYLLAEAEGVLHFFDYGEGVVSQITFNIMTEGGPYFVSDVTGDGLDDVIVGLPDTRQVEVWSKGN